MPLKYILSNKVQAPLSSRCAWHFYAFRAQAPFRRGKLICRNTQQKRPVNHHESFLLRQLPTLPRRLQRSTLGLWTLNYCVRNGNRWNRSGIITALLTCSKSKAHRAYAIGSTSRTHKCPKSQVRKDTDDWLTLPALYRVNCRSLKTSQKKL